MNPITWLTVRPSVLETRVQTFKLFWFSTVPFSYKRSISRSKSRRPWLTRRIDSGQQQVIRTHDGGPSASDHWPQHGRIFRNRLYARVKSSTQYGNGFRATGHESLSRVGYCREGPSDSERPRVMVVIPRGLGVHKRTIPGGFLILTPPISGPPTEKNLEIFLSRTDRVETNHRRIKVSDHSKRARVEAPPNQVSRDGRGK